MMHLKWQLLCQGKLEAVNEICEEENNVICERAESFKDPESTESKGHFEKESCCIHPDDHDHEMSDEEIYTKETTEALGEFSDLRSTSNFQAMSTADSGTADWDDADPGCADFWGSSPVESQSKLSSDKDTCGEKDSGDKDFWGAGVPASKPTSMEPSFRDEETPSSLEKIISPRDFEAKHCSKEKNTEIMPDVGAKKSLDVNLNMKNAEAEVENKNKSELPQESNTACSRFNDESVGLADSVPMFVIPDSDEDEQDSEGRVYHTQTRWKPVLKQDPFPQQETLHLSYEEVFFQFNAFIILVLL